MLINEIVAQQSGYLDLSLTIQSENSILEQVTRLRTNNPNDVSFYITKNLKIDKFHCLDNSFLDNYVHVARTKRTFKSANRRLRDD